MSTKGQAYLGMDGPCRFGNVPTEHSYWQPHSKGQVRLKMRWLDQGIQRTGVPIGGWGHIKPQLDRGSVISLLVTVGAESACAALHTYAMRCRCATRARTPIPADGWPRRRRVGDLRARTDLLIMATRGLVLPNVPSRQGGAHIGRALVRSWDMSLVNPSHPAPENSILPRTTSLMNAIEFRGYEPDLRRTRSRRSEDDGAERAGSDLKSPA